MNRLMIVLLTFAVLLLAHDAFAEAKKELRKIEFKGDADKDGVIEIVVPAEGGTVNVLKLEKPGITESRYAILGEVSYSDVKEAGYLEMWSFFDDGGFYFSRTLGDSGPMGVIKGSSDWRSFILPFYSKPGVLPNRIEVNVVLPKGGTVKLRPAKLVEYPAPPTTQKSSSAGGWWDDRTGGWIGGILGSMFGLLGGFIGLLLSREKGRRVVIPLVMTVLVVCLGILALGIVALLMKQPYAVWYPLLLIGVLGSTVIAFLLPTIKRRYEQQELRRMIALDVV